ncbi:hypothetical protein DL240_17995 [Lujinxingia litoralis]|uniref:Uncharacterized protein n=2 Tax=Lujinxingia litoralis TaxID=2211119 RepID=A0A328C396_9DELT|nr:hypothetical protein DL240_17995 [Lujinxingia litoralis]
MGATLVWAGASVAVAQESVASDAERVVQALAEASQEGEALGLAAELVELRRLLPGELFEGYVERARAGAVRGSTVDFMLAREQARSRLDRGAADAPDRQAFGQEQGCLNAWSVVGPLENPSMQGFYEAVGPELRVSGPYPGRSGSVDWRALPAADDLCVWSVGSFVTPATSAVVFLSTRVSVNEAVRAELKVGAAGAYRVWVDGEPLGATEGEPGLGLDAQSWPLRLSKGEHEIVIKLGSSAGGRLGLVARLVDGEQRALEVRAGAPTRALAPGEAPAAKAGALQAVRRVATRPRAGARARARAARAWQYLQPEDGATPWRDVAREVLGAPQAPGPEVLVELAPLFEERWQRVALLERARELQTPESARWAQSALLLAEAYGEGSARQEWQRQREILEEVVAVRPGYLPARLALARVYQARDLGPLALQVLERWPGPAGPDRQRVPAWVRATADAHQSYGDRAQAARLRELANGVLRRSGAYQWQAMKEALAAGKSEEALAVARRQWELNPWSMAWGQQVVRVFQARNELAQAREVLEKLIAWNPGDAGLHERQAELYLQEGQGGLSAEAMQAALALRPQDAGLRARAELMQPPRAHFYEPWIEEDLRGLAQAHPPGPYDRDYLVDQAVVEVGATGLARRFEQRVVRVIEARGIGAARQMGVSFQGGDERVEVLAVRVHKADGTVSEDFDEWRSGQSRKGSTTYNDSEQLNLRANNVGVGDLVEFQYVVHQVANENFRGDYFGAVHYVQQSRPAALVRYAVAYPQSWELYFRPPRLPHQVLVDTTPAGETVAGRRLQGFELREVPRVYTDHEQPGYTEVYDYVMVSNKADYDAIGRWWWELIEEQLVVDDAIRQQVTALTAGLTEERAKVEAIYDYVARNTRYLHVGLGIHGWKPYRTSTVLRNRYGDCKDKAALLKVMLEEAGVEAEMVLVRTRRLGAVESSVASMHIFNHAVTYVPGLDLFLDATAEYNGPFELTSMDQGAQALVVEDGGSTRWVTMPVDEPGANRLVQSLEIDLSGEQPVMRGELEAHGARAVRYRQLFEDPERRDEALERELAGIYGALTLRQAEYEGIDALGAPTRVRFEAEHGEVIRGQGAGYLYPLAVPRDVLGAYAGETTRHQDRMFRVPFAEETRVRYVLGPQRAVERVPEDRQIRSKFGEMQVSYHATAEDLVVDVAFEIAVQRVPVEEYEAFRAFVSQVHETLNQTLRLVGEGGGR